MAMRLRALETAGVIQSFSDGLMRRFYPLAIADRHESRADELRRCILRLAEQTLGTTEVQIPKCLRLSQQLTNYHLKRLVGSRLLFRVKGHDKISYFVNDGMIPRRDSVS
jgi:predicted transcriptional regulator